MPGWEIRESEMEKCWENVVFQKVSSTAIHNLIGYESQKVSIVQVARKCPDNRAVCSNSLEPRSNYL